MKNKEKKALTPISLEVYRQMVYDCGARLMEDGCDKTEIITRLIDLADRPIRMPNVKVIIEDGIASEVLADTPIEAEIISIDKDYEDYDKLRAYEDQLYKDESLKSVKFSSANFEESEE